MLDFSWAELLVVLIVAVLAIGPKQIPEILYHIGRFTRRIQYMKFALTKQFDDFMDETEMKHLGQDVKDLRDIPNNFFDESIVDEELDIELSKKPHESKTNHD
jgi:sec-independent protein translocase protein TatB